MSEMEDKLIEILQELREDINLQDIDNWISDEVLDSFDIVNLLILLEEGLGIQINVEDIIEENFDSFDKLKSYIESINK